MTVLNHSPKIICLNSCTLEMKLRLGISVEKLSDLSGAIVEVLTHYGGLHTVLLKPTVDPATDWTYTAY